MIENNDPKLGETAFRILPHMQSDDDSAKYPDGRPYDNTEVIATTQKISGKEYSVFYGDCYFAQDATIVKIDDQYVVRKTTFKRGADPVGKNKYDDATYFTDDVYRTPDKDAAMEILAEINQRYERYNKGKSDKELSSLERVKAMDQGWGDWVSSKIGLGSAFSVATEILQERTPLGGNDVVPMVAPQEIKTVSVPPQSQRALYRLSKF